MKERNKFSTELGLVTKSRLRNATALGVDGWSLFGPDQSEITVKQCYWFRSLFSSFFGGNGASNSYPFCAHVTVTLFWLHFNLFPSPHVCVCVDVTGTRRAKHLRLHKIATLLSNLREMKWKHFSGPFSDRHLRSRHVAFGYPNW